MLDIVLFAMQGLQTQESKNAENRWRMLALKTNF